MQQISMKINDSKINSIFKTNKNVQVTSFFFGMVTFSYSAFQAPFHIKTRGF